MEFASVSKKRIEAFIELHIGSRKAWLLEEATRQRVPPSEIAIPLTMQRFEEVRRKAVHPTPMARLFGFALDLYRGGIIPGPLVAALALPYFKRSLALDYQPLFPSTKGLTARV